jgi:hypothetical protein
MTSLLHHPAPVHAIQLVGLPETLPFAATPAPDYCPTPEDLAYDTGWTIGLEDGRFRLPSAWLSDGRGLRFALGRQEGQRHRERDAARELGHALGLETELSEPPAGLRRHEAEAFRAGFAEGQAERERLLAEERDEDSHYDALAAERMEWAFGGPLDRVHQAELAEICGSDVARHGYSS